MDSEAFRLGELVCARVCHDLGGLAGTLAGALELAQDGDGEAVALAREAAVALARRLRLLRAALGPVSEPLGAPGIADLAAGLGERVQVDAAGLGPGVLDGERTRLALAMLLLGAEALPAGGRLGLASMGGMLRVTPDGARAGWPPGVLTGTGDTAPREPRHLLALLTRLLAAAAGMVLAVEETPPALSAVPLGQSQT